MCSRASGDRRVLCFALVLALVAFGGCGLILTLGATPTIPKCAGEPHAVRVDRLVTIVAKQDEALVIATAAYHAWA